VSWAEFDEVYQKLGIEFEEVRGESAYEADMPAVIDMLAEKGLSAVSEGALVVPLDDTDMPPLLLRKQDGATLYGTRDLAAAIYRHQTYGFERSLYVVDRGQGLHFRQLFEVLRRAGFDWAERCVHVPFGIIRMGGRKTGSREGNVVLLKNVLAEAESRAVDLVRANNPDMDERTATETARMVGVGAVVFANLASQREKDIDFDWAAVLSVNGDSGPYIQYAHARCCSILRKAAERGLSPDAAVDPAALTHETEWALARRVLEFGEFVHRAADSSEPHIVSRYLLDLCAAFSRWYTAGNQDKTLRALVDDEAVARARITLVATAREVLRRGLALLGLEAPADM
jgi:arginyl-tRNA synthetase